MLLLAASALGQAIPPAEPPMEMPHDVGTLHVRTQEVLVPTLVEKKGGRVVYGLKADDFILDDNGVRQKIRVQEEMDTAPVALVVAVEQGGVSPLEFDKLAHLGPLLDMFLAEEQSKVALVGFDSIPHLLVDFTRNPEPVNQALKHMNEGDGGSAILDTVSYAVDLLREQPRNTRRVLLLVSEERDHGSRSIKAEQLIKKIGMSDVLVVSVAFSPMRAEVVHDLKAEPGEQMTNIFGSLLALVQAFRKNVNKEIAVMSGGEYTTFTGNKSFERDVLRVAAHARNRYLISFSPSNPTPGLHSLSVTTATDYGAKIVARANYWAEGDDR